MLYIMYLKLHVPDMVLVTESSFVAQSQTQSGLTVLENY